MSERENSFFSFSILSPWSNFIFIATISIYQLMLPTREFLQPEITSEEHCCTPTRKAFLQMTLPIFLTVCIIIFCIY